MPFISVALPKKKLTKKQLKIVRIVAKVLKPNKKVKVIK